MMEPVTYEQWERDVPSSIRNDALWKVEAYRLALFLGDICWRDISKLTGDRRTRSLADQLYRSVGSISANLAEGYSRGTGRDRARFYEYALGSARESRDWYYKGRHVLGEEVTTHRIAFVTSITRLLLTMIPQQRGTRIRDASSSYIASVDESAESLSALLHAIPFP